MPTGLTAAIYEDQEGYTFEDFVWRCARHMTPLIRMRDADEDAPIPTTLEPEISFTSTALRNSQELLEQVTAMDDVAAQSAATDEYEQALARIEEAQAEKLALRARYERMKEQVEAWEPPSQHHMPLKALMLKQLDESIRYDTEISRTRDEIERLDGPEWRERTVKKLTSEITRYESQIEDEKKRAEFNNTWLRQLRESLPPREYRTKTGRVLTEDDIQELADEAEQGYDISHLKDDQ